jgi:NADPH-dependent glutamate synthase beta subunit-like oxidoreductase/Pyruvate/2-oxoacid:ferredoxin oxidoreductase delta subunit
MNAPLPIPAIWTTGSTASIKTGTWRAALARHIQAPSPCHAACPVGGDIAEWIGHARERDLRTAWETLTRHNPFPAIAGRICHHPCESACNRGGFDEALAICKLERFVGDQALEQGWPFASAERQRSERIAVVGGGPAGLSAAFQLRRRGYRVTLVEAQAELGGLMRYGIPPYRLPRKVLDGEIDRIVALGVDVRCGQALGSADDFARLRGEHDAVYLALGASRPKRLPQLDYQRHWVVDGADYLARCSRGSAPPMGRRVVVIGGGSAALDAARSARRAGHEVTILALEDEERLPAQREEVVEAREEGITLLGSAMLQGASETDDGAAHLDCVRVHFEPGTQRGRFTVTPIAGSEFALMADAIVVSIGQDPELAPLGTLEASDALLKIDAAGATSATGVWAGGDVASMARFVTEAIGMGKRAALAIDRHFAGNEAQPSAEEALVTLGAINLHYHPVAVRPAEQRLPAAARQAHSGEVQLGLAIEQALAESTRCFSCGTCTHCDNCIAYCPDVAVQRAGTGYAVLTDYCKGCGLCVKECPTGSMKMQEELR